MIKKLHIKRLGQQDVLAFQKLIILFQEVFETEKLIEVNESYLLSLLKKPDFIVYVAIVENEIVGGLTAYELPSYYSENSEIFIYDIAINSKFQRKGLGKQLLLTLKEYCTQNRITLMFVEANVEDNHAVDFYHSTGGKSEKVVHFNYFLDKD